MSELEAQEFPGGEPAKSEREGLPPGYRMRADPHYVELLSSGGRADRARAEARTLSRDTDLPAPSASPRVLCDRRVFDQLSEDIAAIESAAGMLASETSPLARRVSLDLIKAQAARAAWLLRAHALLGGAAPEAAPKRRPVGLLLGAMRDRLAVECRLVGVGLQVATDAPAEVTIDDTTLSLGVTGAVLALLGLVAGTDGALIRIEPIVEQDGEEDDLQAVEISQDVVAITVTARQRFFEPDWTDRPGGWLAATGAAVAQAASERLGGRATLTAGTKRGCVIRLGFA